MISPFSLTVSPAPRPRGEKVGIFLRLGRASLYRPFGWLAGLVLLAVSCAPPPPMRRDWRPEQGFEALLEVSIAPFERLADLTAEAEIAMRQAGVEERATALVQLKNPDLFRLEVRGPLFSHLFTALLRQDTLMVYGAGVGGNWQGAADGPLLALLTGGTMWLQQKMVTPPATDPKQRQMTQMTTLMMPLMFGLFTLQFPSGLAVYWVVSNIVGIVIQYVTGGWGYLRAPAVSMPVSVSQKPR